MYQVFISYRRVGGFETAKHLFDLLKADGYAVSFDIDTLREGNFDRELLHRVEECDDFILVVDRNCFDRTLDPNFSKDWDWLRQELAYALQLNKNIIPILLLDASFPKDLPEDICEVSKKNGPPYSKVYFDAFYEKLKSFLHSQPKGGKARVRITPPAGATVTFYTQVPCRVEERGKCLTEVYPGYTGADVILRRGHHRLFFVNLDNPLQFYSQDCIIEDVEKEELIDISFKASAPVKTPKPIVQETDLNAEELYQQALQHGYDKKSSKSFECLKRSAEMGLAKAQYSLGLCFKNGTGTRKSPAQARAWFRKAAEQGHPDAQYELGLIYYFGEGITRNETEAAKWFLKAAEQNHREAQYWIGKCYERGIGVTWSASKGKEWYRKAAENGNEEAKVALQKRR